MNILDFIDDIDPNEISFSDGHNDGDFYPEDSLNDTESDVNSHWETSLDDSFFLASDGTDLNDDMDIVQPSFDMEEPESMDSPHDYKHQSHISFTGNGRCRLCNCGKWAGFGDTCENCGHFYNKHI